MSYMKLAVSNIAWANEEESEIADLLSRLGVRYIEVAPTKKWQDPTRASQKEIDEYISFWQSHGIEIVAFQSMLFNRPDLRLFEDEDNRAQTRQYLFDFIGLAAKMGAGVMVFGSPKNRQHGEMDDATATGIAKAFFNELGQVAQAEGVKFCIEPNAPQYSCDFVTNASQGIGLVQSVNNPGFGLHLDIACMTLAGDDVSESIETAAPLLRHFHVSSPMLEDVMDRPDVDHRAAARALRKIQYEGYASIEMKPGQSGENAERVKRAVEFAQSIYA